MPLNPADRVRPSYTTPTKSYLHKTDRISKTNQIGKSNKTNKNQKPQEKCVMSTTSKNFNKSPLLKKDFKKFYVSRSKFN